MIIGRNLLDICSSFARYFLCICTTFAHIYLDFLACSRNFLAFVCICSKYAFSFGRICSYLLLHVTEAVQAFDYLNTPSFTLTVDAILSIKKTTKNAFSSHCAHQMFSQMLLPLPRNNGKQNSTKF